MLKYRARDKKALYFEKHTTIQLYKLPHVDQEVLVTFSTRVFGGNLEWQTGGGHVIRPCGHVRSSQRANVM